LAAARAAPNSKAPMSQAPARGAPRWSAAGQPLPALMAGLPACRAMVRVGPPLLAGGDSSGLMTGIASLFTTTGRAKHGLSLGSSYPTFATLLGRSGYSMLLPSLVSVPPQLLPLL
jgi:hypothetical protein